MTQLNPDDAPDGYVAVPSSTCLDCAFADIPGPCDQIPCSGGERSDRTNVIFVKRPAPVEKAAPPYRGMLARVATQIGITREQAEAVATALISAQQAAQPVVDHACTPTAVVGHEAPNVRDKDAQPVAPGSWAELKLAMEHSAFDGRLELSDALANIDDFAASAAAQPVAGEPVAWRIQQGTRVYFVSAAEFSRSSYDHGSFVPLYTAATAPVGLSDALLAEIRALPTTRAPEIDGEESDGTPKYWRSRPYVSLTQLERLLSAHGIKAGKDGAA